MSILRSPEGWTGSADVDGLKVEGSSRSEEAPFTQARENDNHRVVLEQWMRAYGPEEVFDGSGQWSATRGPAGSEERTG
jgi:xylulose-5-phosphate/fructose-6-phosphate phosphoketolase